MQVLIQPVFRVVELWASRKWPESEFITKEYPIGHYIFSSKKITLFSINHFRLSWRTFFVVMVTVVALALPFFTDMLALMGAIGYWPMVVYFPVEMHIAQNKIGRRTMKWFRLQLLSLICFLISLAAASGAIQGLYKNLHTYKPFMSKDWSDLRKNTSKISIYTIYVWTRANLSIMFSQQNVVPFHF